MAANVGVLRWAYAALNGAEGERGRRTLQPGAGKVGEEPAALRQLRSSVNGSLRLREDMLKQED